MKKGDGDVDVTIGSYNGGETCDLVGLYLLDQTKNLGVECGLYKDDGLAVSRLTNRQTENVKKKMCEIFKKNGLKIEIEANLTVVDYLDVTLNLLENTHKPYMKPNDVPLYVHSQSNHPRSVLKNIPRSINDRLSKLSSREEIFNTTTPPYQQAISDAGYNYKLKFKPPTASPPSYVICMKSEK